MSRRPALLTQADVARAIRAAQQTGAAAVEIKIRPDGTIVIAIWTREKAAANSIDETPPSVL